MSSYGFKNRTDLNGYKIRSAIAKIQKDFMERMKRANCSDNRQEVLHCQGALFGLDEVFKLFEDSVIHELAGTDDLVNLRHVYSALFVPEEGEE